MIQDLQFGQFLPDAPDYQNPGLTRCENVYAVASGYDPIQALAGTGRTVTGEIRGAARFSLPNDELFIVVGTTTDLFVLRGATVTASSLSLSLPEGEFWAFDQQNDSVYATCKTHGLFRLADIFSDNTFVTNPGSPPRGSALNVVGDFLVMGNLIDIDASTQPSRIRWSAFNNPTADWVFDVGLQSGSVDMPARYGEVTGIIGGTFDLVFQRFGISRLTYTGGPSTFNKVVIEDRRGCPAPNSIVRVGGNVYFLADDGFCRTDGSGSTVISSDRVWRYFEENANPGAIDLTQGVVDWRNRSIIWSYAPTGFDGLRRQIIYNFGLDRWTTASIEVDWVLESERIPPNMDETDPRVVGDDIVDTDGPSFDSSLYSATGRRVSAFVSGELSEFEGSNLEAIFETGDFQPEPGKRSFVTGIHPIVELPSANATAAAAARDTIGQAKSFSTFESQGSLGFCPLISDGRFHSFCVKIPAGEAWAKASGYQVDWVVSGEA